MKLIFKFLLLVTILSTTNIKQLPKVVNQSKIKKDNLKQVPNLLSYSRIFFTFLINVSTFYNKMNYALFFVIAASISDFLDGYITRKFNATSEYGAKLDLFADKIFSINMLILILKNTQSNMLKPMIYLVLSKEIILVIVRNIYKKDVDFCFIEKIKAAILYISYILYFLHSPSHKICLILGAICSVIAQIHYSIN